MRLNVQEQNAIRSSIHALDPRAKIFLFGSRVHDDQKGGDIDLLILSETLKFSDKLTILAAIHTALGEQKIDLRISTAEKAKTDAFIQSIERSMVPL